MSTLETTYLNWLKTAEEKIYNSVADSFNNRQLGGWNENHITTQVLTSIKNLGTEIYFKDKENFLKWECFKLSGKLENSFGDIAIVVKLFLEKDFSIEGVAFYEAKRQYFNEKEEFAATGFQSLDRKQLTRIQSVTHASNVLFYDVDIKKNEVITKSIGTAIVLSLLEANSPSKSKVGLPNYGELWSKCIGRNFLGLNLDFQPKSIEGIKDLQKTDRKPLVIINISISKDPNLEPILDSSFVNDNIYEILNDTQPESTNENDSNYDEPSGP